RREKRDESFRRRILARAAQQNSILSNGLVQRVGYNEVACRPAVAQRLRKRHQTEVGAAGLGHGKSLCDVLTYYDSVLQRLPQTEVLKELAGGSSIGRQTGIGNGDPSEAVAFEDLQAEFGKSRVVC